jgi:imidazole glycerol phosphate synthase glutamine amidotransferase subunit
MQLLFERSAEDGARGLAWLAGRVEPLVDAPRLPHIGWNAVEQRRPHPLLDGMPGSAPAYFVHSYAAAPADPGVVIAETEYGARFASAIARDRILGLQFHPEKSGPTGQLLLRRFVAMVADRAGDNDGQGSLVARAPVLIGGTRSAAPADAARIVPGAIPSAAPAPR